MENSVIIKSQLVEAQVTGTPSTGRRYNFLEVPNISRNNIVCYAIEAFGVDQLTFSPSGKEVVGGAAASMIPTTGIVVTLVDNKKQEFTYQIPYSAMIRQNNGGFLIYLAPRLLNLTDCYIQITNTTDIATDEVAIFNLYYYEKDL
jgi:hypothetical protein